VAVHHLRCIADISRAGRHIVIPFPFTASQVLFGRLDCLLVDPHAHGTAEATGPRPAASITSSQVAGPVVRMTHRWRRTALP
jgi:hypothetical protein